MHLSLNYRLYGPKPTETTKPPVALIHGLMGYASNWGKIYPVLAADRPVLVYDQRGHGKSQKPKSGYSPSQYASDLYHLLQDLAWPKTHIVGHSMGGRVAMFFAQEYPQHAQSLVLEDSGAEARPDRLEWLRKLLGRVKTPYSDREAAQADFQEAYRDDPLTGNFLFSNIERKENGTYDWRFPVEAMEETLKLGRVVDASLLFRSLTVPTLIIRGALSQEFPQAEAERMAAARTNVELTVVAGAGHYIHSTHAADFLRILSNFLAKHDNG